MAKAGNGLATGIGREIAAVEIVEHVEVDEVQPAYVFVYIKYLAGGVELQKLAFHTFVSQQVVEAAKAYAVGYGLGVLAIVIYPSGKTHVAGVEVVQSGCIVVAEGSGGFVVGEFEMYASPNSINAVNLPR